MPFTLLADTDIGVLQETNISNKISCSMAMIPVNTKHVSLRIKQYTGGHSSR